ncbi:MAG: hypothetical protein J7J78_04390 [Thermoprotei archaeon]|nr:hypothetical protein [Thermoprotei archaeon]
MVKGRKLVAIKNFDEELYRLVKAYASLEGRTVASIFEEAIKQWLMTRSNYGELQAWITLEKYFSMGYKKAQSFVGKNPEKFSKGYMLICNGEVLGVYSSYVEAARVSREKCVEHGLILKLPLRRGERAELELGLPW